MAASKGGHWRPCGCTTFFCRRKVPRAGFAATQDDICRDVIALRLGHFTCQTDGCCCGAMFCLPLNLCP